MCRKSPSRNRCTRRATAFTLVEIVVVLSIMGVVLAIAQPRLQGMVQRDRLRRAGQRVAHDIQLVRSEAIRQRTATAIAMVPDQDAYGAHQYDRTKGAWDAMADPLKSQRALRVALGSNADYRVGIVAASFGGVETLAFDEYGRPSAGGVVMLGAGTLLLEVTVDAATGRPSVGEVDEVTVRETVNPTTLDAVTIPPPEDVIVLLPGGGGARIEADAPRVVLPPTASEVAVAAVSNSKK